MSQQARELSPEGGRSKAAAAAAPALFPPAARKTLASLAKEASRRRAQKAEQGGHGRPRKSKRTVTVDSSRAKTSAEALKICIQQLKWKEFPTGRHFCDIYWHGVSFHDGEVSCSSLVNKYPGMMEMTRKVNFSRAVRTMQELFPDEYKFYPRSWILPEEYQSFVDQIFMIIKTSFQPIVVTLHDKNRLLIDGFWKGYGTRQYRS